MQQSPLISSIVPDAPLPSDTSKLMPPLASGVAAQRTALGSKMVYRDANYYLLARCIAARTGKTLQDWAQREIFKPLGIVGAALGRFVLMVTLFEQPDFSLPWSTC